MRRRWLIALATIIVIATVALALRIADSESDNQRRTEIESCPMRCDDPDIVAEVGDDLCEVLVEFGSVPRSSTTTKTIRVVNKGSTPLVLLDFSTQCRCMWLDLSDKSIDCGDYCDITLSFDSRGEWGSVGNYMEVITSRDNAPIVLWIAADVE